MSIDAPPEFMSIDAWSGPRVCAFYIIVLGKLLCVRSSNVFLT